MNHTYTRPLNPYANEFVPRQTPSARYKDLPIAPALPPEKRWDGPALPPEKRWDGPALPPEKRWDGPALPPEKRWDGKPMSMLERINAKTIRQYPPVPAKPEYPYIDDIPPVSMSRGPPRVPFANQMQDIYIREYDEGRTTAKPIEEKTETPYAEDAPDFQPIDHLYIDSPYIDHRPVDFESMDSQSMGSQYIDSQYIDPQSMDPQSIETKVKKAGVVLYDNVHKKVLTISNIFDQNIGFPKGSTEPGETPYDTAFRELKEETGIHLNPEEVSRYFRDTYIHKSNHDPITFFILDIPNASQMYTDFIPQQKENIYHVKWRSFSELVNELDNANYTIRTYTRKKQKRASSLLHLIFNIPIIEPQKNDGEKKKKTKKRKKKGGRRKSRKYRL